MGYGRAAYWRCGELYGVILFQKVVTILFHKIMDFGYGIIKCKSEYVIYRFIRKAWL